MTSILKSLLNSVIGLKLTGNLLCPLENGLILFSKYPRTRIWSLAPLLHEVEILNKWQGEIISSVSL